MTHPTPDPRLRPRQAPARVSVVVPLYDEAAVLPELRRRLVALADAAPWAVEIVAVDDGSRDSTLAELVAWADADPRVRVVALARNFGHQAAATAGLDHATGDVVVLMDGDLQDPPELIGEMVDAYAAGYDVVYARRRSRAGEGVFKRATAALFYRAMRALVLPDLPADAGDFRLLSRRALAALASMRETHRFLRGMTTWVGFPQTAVFFDRPPRAAGATKYPLRKMLTFAWTAAVSFSARPLRVAFFFAALATAGAVGAGGYAFFRALLGFYVVHGWASIMVVTCLIGAAVLVCLGVLGDYLGKTFEEVKRRPLYVVADTWNLPATTPTERP